MRDLAGHVEVSASLVDGRLSGVAVTSRRPTLAPLLAGKSPPDALGLLGQVYGLCARAHTAAGRCALAAARGEATAPRADADATAEALRELLLAACTGACRAPLPGLLRALAAGEPLPVELAKALAGGDLRPWVRMESLDDLQSVARASDSPLALEARARLAAPEPAGRAAALLPAGDAASSLDGLPRLAPASCRLPGWHGAPAETGALALLAGHRLLHELQERPLLQRWCARLLLLWPLAGCGGAAAPPALPGLASGVPMGDGAGRGAMLTARGLLLHEARIEGGRIASWEILAPTEWNCHPQGPLAGWLEGQPVGDEAGARAAVVACAAALDPCVPVELRLRASA